MWTRSLLKTNAKQVLARNYWIALLVCFVAALLAGGNNVRLNFNYTTDDWRYNHQFAPSLSFFPFQFALGAITAGLVFLALAVGVLLGVFISNPVTVGQKRYFMEGRLGSAPFSTLFSTFGNPAYWNVVKVTLIRNVIVFLWGLLLVVPGIYKAYQYQMVDYLLAENPYLSWQRALELSRQMTDGEKFNIFVLELSFFGWLLLGALLFSVGTYFVLPYIEATGAELYAALRAKAFSLGLTDETELSGFLRY